MANTFLSINDVSYEGLATDEEYSEEEEEILKEVRQGNKRKTDPKQEILAFNETDDEDINNNEKSDDIFDDSDIERGDEHDGIPDSKAWGKQRRSYYNTDFVDQDYSAYNEQEEEQAQQEEEEAKTIQLRLAKQLDEADFFLDLPTGGVDTDDEGDTKRKTKSKESEEGIKLKSDLSGMSQRQKEQLFQKDSPEFAGLISDFQEHLSESQTLLSPILDYSKEKNLSLPIINFVQTKNNMIMTYCTNVTFYLLLKAKRIPIKNHPITKRLVQLKKLLIQLQQKYVDVVKPQLECLLERINSGAEININVIPAERTKSSKKLRMMKAYNEENGQSDDEEYEEAPASKRAKLSDEEGTSTDDEEGEGDEETAENGEDDVERRGITYQIAKNKGLMPHRKKELRNPRVKHRSKFRKALIRRKGAVRTVRKETQRYGGEVSGIKATVKKGIKIKS